MQSEASHGGIRNPDVLAVLSICYLSFCTGLALCFMAMAGCSERCAPVNDIQAAVSVRVWGAPVRENGAVLAPRTADAVKDWIVTVIQADARARGPKSREAATFDLELVLRDGSEVECRVFSEAMLTPWKKYGITTALREELDLMLSGMDVILSR